MIRVTQIRKALPRYTTSRVFPVNINSRRPRMLFQEIHTALYKRSASLSRICHLRKVPASRPSSDRKHDLHIRITLRKHGILCKMIARQQRIYRTRHQILHIIFLPHRLYRKLRSWRISTVPPFKRCLCTSVRRGHLPEGMFDIGHTIPRNSCNLSCLLRRQTIQIPVCKINTDFLLFFHQFATSHIIDQLF